MGAATAVPTRAARVWPNRFRLNRFMESPDGILAVHWDHEPVWVVPSVWCPAFRRPGPAKAGTPNRRFMESPLSFFRMHWNHERTPNPSQEENFPNADDYLPHSR